MAILTPRALGSVAPACLAIAVLLSFSNIAAAESGELLDDLVRLGDFEKSRIGSIGDSVLVNELDVPDRSRHAAFVGLVRIDGSGENLAAELAKPSAEAIGEAHGWGIFSNPPKPADVNSLTFSDSDIEVLADCQVAACKLKLSREGIEDLAAIDWSSEDAGDRFTQSFRKEALAYAEAYRTGGNEALVVYADKQSPVELAKTISSLVSQFEGFRRNAPSFTAYLNEYPDGRRPGMTEALVWAVKDFGYRPTLTVDHVIVDSKPEDHGLLALIASKTIYANHYLAGRIQMGALIDGEAAFGVPGRFIVLVDRIEFDDRLNGLKRKLLGGGLESDVEQRMRVLRGLAEREG